MTSEDRAAAMISDLLMAAVGVGRRSLRDCVAEVFEAMTGERPTETAIDWITGDE